VTNTLQSSPNASQEKARARWAARGQRYGGSDRARIARFRAIVEFNLKDIATSETRRYFMVRSAHSLNPAELKKLMSRAHGAGDANRSWPHT